MTCSAPPRMTSQFDPSNKLTRGLAIRAGYVPIAQEQVRVGDYAWAVNSPAHCASWDRATLVGWTVNAADLSDVRNDPCYVVVRKIVFHERVLANVPDTHEVYDQPTVPPTSVEGWLFVSSSGATRASTTWLKPRDNFELYGVSYVLARPKAAVSTYLLRLQELRRQLDEATAAYALACSQQGNNT